MPECNQLTPLPFAGLIMFKVTFKINGNIPKAVVYRFAEAE